MSTSDLTLASLVSRISQLEVRQNVFNKYLVGVKHQLDQLTEQYNTRPELQQMKSLQGAIGTLSEGFINLQLCFDQLLNLGENPDTIDTLDEAETFDILLQEQEPTNSFVNFDEAEVYKDEQTDNSSEDNQQPATNAEEFLQRVKEKENDFTGINLASVDLTGKNLADYGSLNLSYANLSQAKLRKANLGEANLSQANLRGTELCEAELYKANLSKANLKEANLRKAILIEADLSGADLRRANLLEASLERANLSKANLQQAIYDRATVFPKGFDLKG